MQAAAETRQKESSEEQSLRRKRAVEDSAAEEEALWSEEAQVPEPLSVTEEVQVPEQFPAAEEEQTDRNMLRIDKAEADTFMLPQSDEGELIATADKFDVDKPVIERFEFLENGQTLTENDTIHFNVWAYDSDSGIDYVEISLSGKYGYIITCKKDDSQDKLYTGTYSCKDLAGNHLYVSGIRIRDNVGNINTNWKVWENDQYLYSFTLEGNFEDKEQDDHIKLSNFKMQTNPSNEDGSLRIGDTVTYTADVTCKDETIQNIDMNIYSYANSSWHSDYLTGTYDPASQTLTGTYTVTDQTYPDEWYLDYIYIYTESEKTYYFYPRNIEPDKILTFTVVQDNFDTEKPIIESIAIDKNGQWVYAGDTINITVKVKEDNPSEYAYADFYSTYPWYYKVKSGTTYRVDPKNVTFRFYGYAKQEDGTYLSNSLIEEKTVEAGRRASLKELNVSFPQPIEGVSTEWNSEYSDKIVDEDTELLFYSAYDMGFNFYATYDKGCANVSLSYLTKDSGINSVNLPQFVNKETTFQEVLNNLKLPEDAYTEDFDGFKLTYSDDFHNENTIVGDIASISVTAFYKDCQVAWNTRYMDKDGKEGSKVINKKYSEGTKISDALADLEAPEETNNLEFETWILPEASLDGTLSGTMTSLDAVAVYKAQPAIYITMTAAEN